MAKRPPQITAEQCTAEQRYHLDHRLFPLLHELQKKARARMAGRGPQGV